jgi:hypothetical protein
MARYVFRGGCVGCQSQEIYGEGRCAGCQCLEADWRLPDLRVSEYEAREIETERARRRIKGLSFDAAEVEAYLQKLKERNGKIHERRMRALESLARRESNNSIEDNSSIMDRVLKFFYDLVSGSGRWSSWL